MIVSPIAEMSLDIQEGIVWNFSSMSSMSYISFLISFDLVYHLKKIINIKVKFIWTLTKPKETGHLVA